MKQNKLLKLGGVIISLLMTVNTASAQTTLASWDFTDNVKYSGVTSENKTDYTATAEAKAEMEFTFAENQPFFHPTSGSLSASTLTIWSMDTSKKWYISGFNSGALRMYTKAPQVINNPADPDQHYNYAQVNFSATGYKNIAFSANVTGNNSKSLPTYILVSTDGGTTWSLSSKTNNTGSSWSNFVESSATLAVDNATDVIVRLLIGYNAGATSDMYLNNFKITGEDIGASATYTVSTSAAVGGYVSSSLAGNSFVDGTSLTLTANNLLGYQFVEWQQGGVKVSDENPYTFSVSANANLSAVFKSVATYTLTTATNIAWAGTVTRSVDAVEYSEGTNVTLTAAANSGFEFVRWSDGNTNSSRSVTMDGNKSLTAEFAKIAPTPGTTNVTLVSWTFDGNYTTVDGDGVTIYTPTGTDHAAVEYNYSAQVPVIRPDICIGEDDSYALTIKCDKNWKLEDFSNYGRYILFWMNNNDISDANYTVPTSYNNYFEASFPTTNFTGMNMQFIVSANNENPGMEYGVVYSVDGGSTWSLIQTVNAATHWNGWNVQNVSLPTETENQSKVIVRIIRKGKSDNNQDNKLDYLTITGTYTAQDVTIGATGFATYFNDYAVEIPSGVKAYWGQLSGSKVVLTEITDGIIPANTAVVLEGAANTYALTATSEAGSTYASNALRGVVANTTVSSLGLGSGTVYVLAKTSSTGKAAFCQYTGTTLGDHRAYLFVAGSGAPELSFVFADSNTTGIETISSQQTAGEAFNLQGQRVAQPKKGLYIIGGKKVIIK